MDERKAMWIGQDKTQKKAGSNDDLLTELEFAEALSGLSKDIVTSPGADMVKYLRHQEPVSR